jgi:hypothetical protein
MAPAAPKKVRRVQFADIKFSFQLREDFKNVGERVVHTYRNEDNTRDTPRPQLDARHTIEELIAPAPCDQEREPCTGNLVPMPYKEASY